MCLVALAGILFGCGVSGSKSSPAIPAEPKPVGYRPVMPDRWTLPNGLTVLFLPDDELPLVRATLYLRGGSLFEKSSETGVVAAMGDQLREGGAGALSAEKLDLELEKLAATISSSFGAESGTVGFSCLTSDTERVFSLFSDVLLKPRFQDSRLQLYRGQTLESIRRRTDEPSVVAGVSLMELLYGDSPFGSVVTSDDVKRFRRADLMRWKDYLVRPDGAILAITGKVDKGTLKRLVEKNLGNWKPRGTPLPPLPPVTHVATPGIYFIELPFQQSTIYFGELGVPRLTPDYPAIEAFNGVFGSLGFSSRLMKRVRTELGLAYGVYGSINPGPVRGKNVIALQTKAGSSGEALLESLKILDGLQNSSTPAPELDATVRSLASSFVFKFDTTDAAVQRRALIELLGYPADYDETFIPKLRAVTPEEVQKVARDRWHLDKMVIVVVGNDQAYESISKVIGSGSALLKPFPIRKVEFKERLSPAVLLGQFTESSGDRAAKGGSETRQK